MLYIAAWRAYEEAITPTGQRRERFELSAYGGNVLRITLDRSSAVVRLQLEGRITGLWAQELEHCWRALPPEQRRGAVADLAGVTFIGEDGKQILAKLSEEGAVLYATDCLTRSIVESITGRNPARGRSSQRSNQ